MDSRPLEATTAVGAMVVTSAVDGIATNSDNAEAQRLDLQQGMI